VSRQSDGRAGERGLLGRLAGGAADKPVLAVLVAVLLVLAFGFLVAGVLVLL
jgi:hypothetical protein